MQVTLGTRLHTAAGMSLLPSLDALSGTLSCEDFHRAATTGVQPGEEEWLAEMAHTNCGLLRLTLFLVQYAIYRLTSWSVPSFTIGAGNTITLEEYKQCLLLLVLRTQAG